MSQAVSNLSLLVASKPASNSNTLKPVLLSRGDLLWHNKKRNFRTTIIKAMENLDHLHRNPPRLHRQTHPKKKITTVPTPPIGLWDRFPTVRTVHQMMERIMEDPSAYSPAEVRGRTPWEIKEGDTDYKMRFDMPGMTRDDVKVWVENKMLVVKAHKGMNKSQSQQQEQQEERGVEKEEEEEEWSAKSYGRYSFRIALPENVRFEKIKAEIKDGVLYINIPKSSYDSGSSIFDINVQ